MSKERLLSALDESAGIRNKFNNARTKRAEKTEIN